jgi:hypothetical protein
MSRVIADGAVGFDKEERRTSFFHHRFFMYFQKVKTPHGPRARPTIGGAWVSANNSRHCEIHRHNPWKETRFRDHSQWAFSRAFPIAKDPPSPCCMAAEST